MKQVYSYQEIAPVMEQGQAMVFVCHPEARVKAIQKHQGTEDEHVTVTITLSIRDTCIGIIEQDYTSMLAVLEAFDIDDYAEIWEVGNGGRVSGTCQKHQEKERYP